VERKGLAQAFLLVALAQTLILLEGKASQDLQVAEAGE
jgi:hypothetical protein